MSSGARVSVVIPVHDAAPYVEMAVRSALASDLDEIEVIAVNDGSTDRSGDILASISDPRLLTVQLRASGGPSRPRNVGIARSRAPYIAFLDADDLIKPGRLSAAVTALDLHPEAGFSFTDFEDIDERGAVIRASAFAELPGFRALASTALDGDWRLLPKEELARGLLYENFISTSGVVLRRHLLTETGPFNESLVYAEDLDLWFRLAHRCDALFWNNIGHAYRNRPGSLTNKLGTRMPSDQIAVLQREKRTRTDPVARRQLDRRIAENLAGLAYQERRRHRRLRSAAMFAAAFATFPRLRWLRAMLGSVLS
jgi:glycosyltransferase involved in cell wall biosynthesis